MALRNEINFARGNKFILTIPEMPILTALAQSVDVEATTLNEAVGYNPLLDLKLHGEKLNYTNLDITFLIDENYDVYTEIYNFMNVATGPDTIPSTRRENKTDISIQVLNNNSSAVVRTFTFKDCWVNTIGNLSFDNVGSDTLLSTCTFVYNSFSIHPHTVDTTGFTDWQYTTENFLDDTDVFDGEA